MQQPDIKKLEEFLSRTPVLIAHMRKSETLLERRAKRQAWVIVGEPPSEPTLQHRRLSEEFACRMNALGNDRICIVIDRTRDNFSSAEDIQKTVVRKYQEILGVDDGSRLALKTALALDWATKTMPVAMFSQFGEFDGLKKPCLLILPKEPAIDDVSLKFTHSLRSAPSRFRKNLPISREDIDRIELHHEAFGHGTDAWHKWHSRADIVVRSNMELRADVAALIGVIHDTGNVEAAKSWIFARDLSALRKIRENKETTFQAIIYANGGELRKALGIIQQIPDIRALKDSGLVRLTDKIFQSVEVEKAILDARTNMLDDAFRLVRDAEEGKNTTLPCLPPERLASSVSYLQDCMQAHAFFMKPAQTPRPKPTCPAPRPVMP